MQVYTKVLIGMGVGVTVGILLGPKSPFLAADMYKVSDASMVELRLDRNDETSRLNLPADVPLRLEQLEVIPEQLEDQAGREHQIPAWAKVEFKFSQAMALRDPDGTLRERLNNVEVGSTVTAWLRIEHHALREGGFTTTPIPISGLGDTIVSWLKPVGTLFMNLLKMVIVPLVFSSLLVGVASLGDVRKLGRLGGKTIGLYLVTTAIAVSIGLMIADIAQPGSFVGEADRASLRAQFDSDAASRAQQAAEAPSAVDNILAIIPTNPVASMVNGDMLQIIFFAIIFGVALTLLDKKKGTPVVSFFDRVQEAMIVIIHMVMAVAPFGVAALMADVVGQSGLSILGSLFVYTACVMGGLLLHGGIVYMGLVLVGAKTNPLRFLNAIRPAQLIAFSTSSSSATLPVSMECAEQNLGVSNSVASFVLPLGSTVNMDGTALYQGVAAVFIAQVFGIELTFADQLGIVATATMASIGAAGVPGAGIVTLALVLTAAGIPPVGVAMILGMDRILDMFRTTINVTGDLAVASVIAVTEGETIRFLSKEEDRSDPDRGFEGRLDHEEHPLDPDE